MAQVLTQQHRPNWTLYNADCVDVVRAMPDKSVHLSIYSPPFAEVFVYSASERDMGNCSGDAEFFEHYRYIIGEIYRMTAPGRLTAVHCRDLLDLKRNTGRAGLRDFPGEIIRAHTDAGWQFHGRVTVWKDPVTEMQRTKAQGLLYKQLQKDSTMSRMGCADFVLFFRRHPEPGEDMEIVPVDHNPSDFPVDRWQEWASPVWMDIRQGNVLNVAQARTEEDEKHMCPLQLDLIERVIRLYSNAGEVVFSPFAGIGSEGVMALRTGRRFVGAELKPEYYHHACEYLDAEGRQMDLAL